MCTMGNPNEIRLAIVDNDDFVFFGLTASDVDDARTTLEEAKDILARTGAGSSA